jgi:hypothetical protein
MSFEERQGTNQSTPIKDTESLSADGSSVRKRLRMSSPSPAKGKESSMAPHNRQSSQNKNYEPGEEEHSQSDTLDHFRSNTSSPLNTNRSKNMNTENNSLKVLSVSSLRYCINIKPFIIELESSSVVIDTESISRGRPNRVKNQSKKRNVK